MPSPSHLPPLFPSFIALLEIYEHYLEGMRRTNVRYMVLKAVFDYCLHSMEWAIFIDSRSKLEVLSWLWNTTQQVDINAQRCRCMERDLQKLRSKETKCPFQSQMHFLFYLCFVIGSRSRLCLKSKCYLGLWGKNLIIYYCSKLT